MAIEGFPIYCIAPCAKYSRWARLSIAMQLCQSVPHVMQFVTDSCLSPKVVPQVPVSAVCNADAHVHCRAVGCGWAPLTQQKKRLWHMMRQRGVSGVSWQFATSLRTAHLPLWPVVMCRLFLSLSTQLLVSPFCPWL